MLALFPWPLANVERAQGCDLEPLSIQSLAGKAEDTLQLSFEIPHHLGCHPASLPAASLVTTRLLVEGAHLSQQVNFLCHTRCDFANEVRRIDGNVSVAACSKFDFKQKPLCINMYVPKLFPSRFIEDPGPKVALQRFHEAARMCRDLKRGTLQFSKLHAAHLYQGMVTAFTTLPLPFTLLESGNLCGTSTCYIAAAKKIWCPDCPFISIDPGWTRKALGEDPKCVEKNLADAGLSDQALVLQDTGEEAPIRSPIGFVFNDDGKMRHVVSRQHALWEPYLMDGAVLGYHDYFQETDDPNMVEQPPYHRAHVQDLLETGSFEKLYTSPYGQNSLVNGMVRETEIGPEAWKYDVAVIRKKLLRDPSDKKVKYKATVRLGS